jgi:hypothetical protein
MMFDGLRKTISSLWAESKVFKSIIIAAFFLFMAVAVSLLVVHGYTLLGVSFSILVIIASLVVGIILRKLGYVEKAKELAPKQYSNVRRVQIVVCGGLLTGFAILTALRVLHGPLPYPQSLLLFLLLIVVGAIISDMLARTLRA